MSTQFGAGIPPQPIVSPEPQDSQGLINLNENRQVINVNTPYIPYTPVLSGTSGGFTYGAGASQQGRWKRLGPQVFVYFEINFGNPGFVAGGATTWEISLPVPYLNPLIFGTANNWPQFMLGSVWVRRGTALNQDMHVAIPGSTTSVFDILRPLVVSGTRLNGTSGWDQSAIMYGQLLYETTAP